MSAAPACERPRGCRFRFGGWIGQRLQANLNQWLLTAPIANPAMLQMFRDRDRKPRRSRYRLTGDRFW
jgi:hypothetical protein